MVLSNFFWIFLRTLVGVAKTAFYVTRTRRSEFFYFSWTLSELLFDFWQKTCGSVWKMHQPVQERNLRTFCEKLKTLELRAKKIQTSGKKITTGLPNLHSTCQEEHLEDFCGENIIFFPNFDCDQEVLGLLLKIFCTFGDHFSAGLSNFYSTGPRKKSVYVKRFIILW